MSAHDEPVFEILPAEPLGHGELARLAQRLVSELRISAEHAPFVNALMEVALDVTADVLDELTDLITGVCALEDAPTLALLIAQTQADAEPAPPANRRPS